MLKSLTWVGLFAGAAVAVVAIVAHETIEVVALRASRPPEAASARQPPRLRAQRLAELTGLAQRPGAGRFASPLEATLLGTLIDEDRPERSVALIEDAKSHSVASYQRFDEVLGATIVGIERSRVLVRREGENEVIELRAQPERSHGLITKTAADQFEISRASLERTLSSLDQLSVSARIVPAFRDGIARGFKVFSIRPDSLYASVGIQNGDLIERINGIELTSPEKALALYSTLRGARRLEVELERNGTSLRKIVTVL
jgi:general secretion pathway protein C